MPVKNASAMFLCTATFINEAPVCKIPSFDVDEDAVPVGLPNGSLRSIVLVSRHALPVVNPNEVVKVFP